MPRIKKRKQGLVAKLNSKSFVAVKDAAVVISLRAQLPEPFGDPESGSVIPEYIRRNLVPDRFVGRISVAESISVVTENGPAESVTVDRSSIQRSIPLGIINLGSVADSRWILRRLLSALRLNHLGLENQMYERMYLLTRATSQQCVHGQPRDLERQTAFSSRTARLWNFLAGLNKIVDGERKPLTAILRDSLVANEGTQADREIWALLLAGLTPMRGCSVEGSVKVFLGKGIRVRTVRTHIERAITRLSNVRTGIAAEREGHSEPNKLLVGPLTAYAHDLQQGGSRRAWSYEPTACTAIKATKSAVARINQIDSRRTRLGLLIYPVSQSMPTGDSAHIELLVSPHKALIEIVDILHNASVPYYMYACADPKELLQPLLSKDPKDLSMGEVIRALDRIWPNRGTMISNQHGMYTLRESCWRWDPVPIQHAKHTT
jgi:hypothetical protein